MHLRYALHIHVFYTQTNVANFKIMVVMSHVGIFCVSFFNVLTFEKMIIDDGQDHDIMIMTMTMTRTMTMTMLSTMK